MIICGIICYKINGAFTIDIKEIECTLERENVSQYLIEENVNSWFYSQYRYMLRIFSSIYLLNN